jgi:hypothetical protein
MANPEWTFLFLILKIVFFKQFKKDRGQKGINHANNENTKIKLHYITTYLYVVPILKSEMR